MKALLILWTLVAISTAQIVFPNSGSSQPSGGSSSSSGIIFEDSSSSSSSSSNNVDDQLLASLSLSNSGLSSNNRATLLTLLSGNPTSEGSFCRLPNGNAGTCGRLSQCSAYRSQFANIFGLVDFFVLRICSFTRRTALVCCPQQQGFNPLPTTRRPTPRPTPRSTPRPTTSGPFVPNSLFPSKCGSAVRDRVVGGDEIPPGAYPWLVAIGSPAIGRFSVSCGGSLITSQHVVTAAHCFDFTIPSHVRIGEHDVTNTRDGANPQDLRIIDIKVHTGYNKKLSENDIAVLKLERDVFFTRKRIQPICLPFGNDLKSNTFESKHLDVVGWGTTDERVRRTSPVPREAKVRVNSLSSCKEAYSDIGNIRLTNNQLCAGRDGTDSCQGDSGGPLNYLDTREDRWYLAGIVSTGVGCGRSDFPGVYVRVGAYLDWIVSNVQ